MAIDVVEDLKTRVLSLSPEDMRSLADFLGQEYTKKIASSKPSVPSKKVVVDEARSMETTEWLKLHQEQYEGQYVALVGTQLVGLGRTIRDAHIEAKSHGHPDAFLVYVPRRDGEYFGGW
jgi:hypothetical protein